MYDTTYFTFYILHTHRYFTHVYYIKHHMYRNPLDDKTLLKFAMV